MLDEFIVKAQPEALAGETRGRQTHLLDDSECDERKTSRARVRRG